MVMLDIGHMHTRAYLHTHTRTHARTICSSRQISEKEAIVSVWKVLVLAV